MKLSGVLGNWCLSLCSIFLCLFVLVGQVAGQQAPTTVNQVWVLTNANGAGGPPAWIQVMPTGGPPPTKIFGASVVYDSSNNRLILFGGNDGSFPTNDVWVLANANGLGGVPTWTQLATARLGLLSCTSQRSRRFQALPVDLLLPETPATSTTRRPISASSGILARRADTSTN